MFNQQSGHTSEDWKPAHEEQIPKGQNYKTGKQKKTIEERR